MARVKRNLPVVTDEDTVASVIDALPPSPGINPTGVVPHDPMQEVLRRQGAEAKQETVVSEALDRVVARLDEIAETLLGRRRSRGPWAREDVPAAASSLEHAFASAVEAQELISRRNANERRRLQAQQELLGVEIERLEIEDRERSLLLDQLREVALDYPPDDPEEPKN